MYQNRDVLNNLSQRSRTSNQMLQAFSENVMTTICLSLPFIGSNVMRSIHGVGELMTQVVLRGGGFLPMTPMATAPEGNVKQAEPEKEDIMVMDTKLKIIEILQVWFREQDTHRVPVHYLLSLL